MGYFDNYNVDANTPFVIVGGSAGQIGLSKERYWAADDCAFFACHDIYKEYLYYVLLLNQSNILLLWYIFPKNVLSLQHDKEIKLLDFNNYQLTVIMKVIHSILSFSPSIALSQAIVCFLLAFSPAVYSKNINPRKAAKIAQRYVTLPQSQEVKAKSKGFSQTADTPYYIYNDARGSGFVIVSGNVFRC